MFTSVRAFMLPGFASHSCVYQIMLLKDTTVAVVYHSVHLTFSL